MLEEFVGIDVSEMLRAVLTSIIFDPETSKIFPEDERQQFSVRHTQSGPNVFISGTFLRDLRLCSQVTYLRPPVFYMIKSRFFNRK